MRDVKFDNIKGLLIILTVFGHMLELTSGGTASQLYRLIYSFHMPAFVFISGYFARWSPKKLFTFYLPLYLISQFAYLLFDQSFIGAKSLSARNFFTPYWHLWYLLALMIYQLLIPILSKISSKNRITAIIVSIATSLIIPLVKTDLYPLSIGRFFAFLPFFAAGHFCGRCKKGFPNMTMLVPLSLIFILSNKNVSLKTLYGSFSYSEPSEILIRAALILFAFGWISLLLHMPGFNGSFSSIGQNTLPIYLIHGFILRSIKIFGIKIETPLTALLLSAVICSALANMHFQNPPKAVDSILKKVYNIINCERSFFTWISKKKSKKS